MTRKPRTLRLGLATVRLLDAELAEVRGGTHADARKVPSSQCPTYTCDCQVI
jgi:hypothetical protein